jgi:hypothetical protein
MGCNAQNHPSGCNCGFGGDTGGGSISSNLWDVGYEPLPQYASRQVTYNTTCPLCGKPCYYYENEFGSKVWFEELGVPWIKHPCFNIRSDHRTRRPEIEFDVSTDRKATVQQLFLKRLWRNGNWHFFSVLEDLQVIPQLDFGESRETEDINVEDYERAIGHFFARHPVDDGLFTMIVLPNGVFLAMPNDAAKAFKIFPVVWLNTAFNQVGRLQIQRRSDCFRQVLESAESIVSNQQSRIYLAERLYDLTDLPFETIAFLSRVQLIKVIEISNGSEKPVYVQNPGKVRRVAAEIAGRLYGKLQRS